MTIGQRIIKSQRLSIEQASEVCADLNCLSTIGIWDPPKWAMELADHYEVGEAHIVIQLAGWKAAAKGYEQKLLEMRYLGDKD